MDAAQLLEQFRSDSGDDVGPSYLWSDALVLGYLTEAEQQACIRGDLIRFERAITLVPADESASIALASPRITKLVKARLQWPDSSATAYFPLSVLGVDDQDDDRRDRSGRPCRVFVNDQTLILDRIPTEAGVLHLEGYREPTYEIESTADEPEIANHLHRALVAWALYRAFGRKDSQTWDQPRADRALADFTNTFGPLPPARHLRGRREKRPVTVRRSRSPYT